MRWTAFSKAGSILGKGLGMGGTPPSFYPRLYGLVGSFIVNWALFESSLNFTITVIYRNVGGRQDTPLIPGELRRKFEFLRRSYKTLAPLASYRAAGDKILDEGGNLRVFRDAFVHGAFSEYEASTQTFTFVPLDAKGDIYFSRPVRFRDDRITRANCTLAALTRDSLHLAQSLMDKFVL